MVMVFFGLMAKNLVPWCSIFLVLWIWSSVLDGNSITTWWLQEWLVKECRKTLSFTELKYLSGLNLALFQKMFKFIQLLKLKLKITRFVM